jgi:hypothetical protein
MLKSLWLMMGVVTVAATLAVPAFAHEGRRFLPYIVFVGFRNEPAFEDEGNALDFFVLFDTDGDGECTAADCSDWVAVNRGAGDQVDLKARVQYLEADTFDAKVIASARLRGAVEQDFADPSRYNIFFKPNVDGAYGFLIEATLKYNGSDPNFPTPGPLVTIGGNGGKFVCEGGSQDPEEVFNCVDEVLQPFPLGVAASYRNDPPLGHPKASKPSKGLPKALLQFLKRR